MRTYGLLLVGVAMIVATMSIAPRAAPECQPKPTGVVELFAPSISSACM